MSADGDCFETCQGHPGPVSGPEPAVVDTVARAMHEVPGQPGVYGRIPWDRLMEQHREAYRGMARVAIAALPPSPAEEAVKRVEAAVVLLEKAAGHHRGQAKETRQPFIAAKNAGIAEAYRAAVEDLRAALAPPAPAPQDANGCPDQPHHGVDCPGDACRYAALAPQGECCPEARWDW